MNESKIIGLILDRKTNNVTGFDVRKAFGGFIIN